MYTQRKLVPFLLFSVLFSACDCMETSGPITEQERSLEYKE